MPLLSVLFFEIAFLPAFTCNAQTVTDSIAIEPNEYALTEISQMGQSIGIYIDSIAYSGTASETNTIALSKAANIGREKVKFMPSSKSNIIIYFRKEIMIGDY